MWKFEADLMLDINWIADRHRFSEQNINIQRWYFSCKVTKSFNSRDITLKD